MKIVKGQRLLLLLTASAHRHRPIALPGLDKPEKTATEILARITAGEAVDPLPLEAYMAGRLSSTK